MFNLQLSQGLGGGLLAFGLGSVLGAAEVIKTEILRLISYIRKTLNLESRI